MAHVAANSRTVHDTPSQLIACLPTWKAQQLELNAIWLRGRVCVSVWVGCWVGWVGGLVAGSSVKWFKVLLEPFNSKHLVQLLFLPATAEYAAI